MSETIDAEVVKPNTETALVVHQAQPAAPTGLFGTQDPVTIIKKASEVATSLKAVISKQGLISKISGKEYPKCEAWTLLGTMVGVFPVLCWTKPVEDGWEARVEARTIDGAIVGAAEAQCLRAERNWSNRDGFALRSMAQTRATAKCLRMPLGFVMTLAGYEATPAEEMVADHPQTPQKAPPAPPPAAGKPAAPRPAPTPQPAPKAPPAPAPTTKRLKPATVATRQWMLEEFKDARDLLEEYFRAIGWLIPTEKIERLELRFVPNTKSKIKSLKEKLAEFGNGEQASKPYPSDEIPPPDPAPAKPKAAPRPPDRMPDEPPEDDDAEDTKAKAGTEALSDPAKDPEWWRDIIIPVPHKGQKKADYDKHPDTIGSLFDLRRGSDDEAQAARQRLFGLVHNFDPQPREFKGKIYQPSAADHQCRKALDAFWEWFQREHPGEKI